jgi:hypothetical protein
VQVTADVMPADFITFRLELNHRAASAGLLRPGRRHSARRDDRGARAGMDS